jgi:deoxyribonuclease V
MALPVRRKLARFSSHAPCRLRHDLDHRGGVHAPISDENARKLRQIRAATAWPESTEALIGEQNELARAEPAPWRPDAQPVVAGCFVCFPRGETGRGRRGDPGWAAAAALAGTVTVAEAVTTGTAGGPYEPGLLALREGPLLEAAVRAAMPDVLLVDATGRDHPRRAGLALHLGAVLDLPTVGVTHRPLIAKGAWPTDVRGASSPLLLEGEPVGAWLRTRRGARPLAVHPAWRTTTDVAVHVVLATLGRYRTPEPLRRARHLARLARP